ncbi:unnamed protein product [Porites lobata]|uniref:Vps16 N-terminal domain-containing protein n=1 Tax=Porites lobata TaxID=104759 RepID=A0ABN8P583_9CNID|nr:unnamed protein product [Porites lobata]
MPHDRGSSLLVAIDNLLYLTEKGQCNRLTVSFSAGAPVTSIIEMAISYNYEYLAMFTDTGLLWIGSADLQKVYCEFNTSCPSRPKQLTWCAMGGVICYWDDYLDHTFLTYFTYQMDSVVHLVQELDGVRIIGNETHELLQRVPAAVEQVFKIGSMEPGAMLFDASKEFEASSASLSLGKTEEYIRMIKERLPEAVQQCIHAAAAEHEPAIQRGLLRAASFGESFLTDMPPHAFVSMCRNLRVLNAVRDYMVGIPLTYGELEKLTMKTLIDRIVLKRQRRAEPFVSMLCTVISKSKSSRPIGTQKSLGYCKSLDCVAAVLRGIGKSEKGRGKGKRKRGQLFFISAPFPFTPLHLSPRLCTCHANCHAGYCEIYIFTLA